MKDKNFFKKYQNRFIFLIKIIFILFTLSKDYKILCDNNITEKDIKLTNFEDNLKNLSKFLKGLASLQKEIYNQNNKLMNDKLKLNKQLDTIFEKIKKNKSNNENETSKILDYKFSPKNSEEIKKIITKNEIQNIKIKINTEINK